MSSPTCNVKLWSYARACRRLAADVRPWSEDDGVNSDSIEAVSSCLQEAAEHLSAEVKNRTHRASNRLVENVLNQLLDPQADELTVDGEQPSEEHVQALAISGSLVEVPDLISFLSSTSCTGVLAVETDGERFQMDLLEGDVVHAQSNGTPHGDRIGDILVEQGALTRAEVEAVLASKTAPRLGLALIESGLVDQDQLMVALEEQIRRQFARMFEATPKNYTFWSGPPTVGGRHPRMNSMGLILDSARVADERVKCS